MTPSLLPLGLPEARPPCLSIYQPTHRSFPDRQQDPIRFRNHLRTLDASLRQRHDAAMVDALLAPLLDLAADARFWTQTLDGLAVMASPAGMRWWRLQRPVLELAIAARSWHLKPLLRILQSADRFQVLALTRHTVRLYEGNRDVLDEVELHPDVPRSPGDLPAPVPTGSQQDIDVATGQAGQRKAIPARGSKQGDHDLDDEKYFRAVDRTIAERHGKPSGLPMLLAALPEHQALFRRISHNPLLLSDGIAASPTSLTADALRRRAWAAIEPALLQRLDGLRDDFGREHGRGLGSDDVTQIAEATVAGRVRTLLLQDDRLEGGRLHPGDGRVFAAPLDDPQTDDLFDDLAEAVLRHGGEVLVVPPDRMPAASGIAAVYRY